MSSTGSRPLRRSETGVLGLQELVKPPELAARVGCWFGGPGSAPVLFDDGYPGMRRFYTEDPHGNRLEFLEPID